MENALQDRDILFIDKVFLSELPDLIRGVELFNLRLIEDIARLGRHVDVICHKSWEKRIKKLECLDNINVIPVDCGSRSEINGLASAFKLFRAKGRADRKRGAAYPIMLLGNVANGLLPTLSILRLCGIYEKSILIAHRQPSSRFLAGLSRKTEVVAVNQQIGSEFRKAGFQAGVYYGVTNADAFNNITRTGKENRNVDFCVLGYLDNAWKGADTAIAGFMGLPPDVREKCRLHLVAFENPPEMPEDRIIAYNWMPSAQIPEFLSSMDIMIVPSRDEKVMRETFCQAMVQGMLTGLPVIANNLPVLTEKLDEGGGLVFSSTRELTLAMEQLCGDADKRIEMGELARKTAESRYVWNTADFLKCYC